MHGERIAMHWGRLAMHGVMLALQASPWSEGCRMDNHDITASVSPFLSRWLSICLPAVSPCFPMSQRIASVSLWFALCLGDFLSVTGPHRWYYVSMRYFFSAFECSIPPSLSLVHSFESLSLCRSLFPSFTLPVALTFLHATCHGFLSTARSFDIIVLISLPLQLACILTCSICFFHLFSFFSQSILPPSGNRAIDPDHLCCRLTDRPVRIKCSIFIIGKLNVCSEYSRM